jgi:glycosyltransferase involved in cell wall biosynthesis
VIDRKNIAYLVSRYPAVSHTFIMREILYLRSLGWNISTISINASDLPPSSLSKEDVEEIPNTFYVKKQGVLGALAAIGKAFFIPIRGLKGLGTALKNNGLNPFRITRSLFYFIEALIIGFWLQKKEIGHLHVHFANPASTVALIISKVFDIPFSITVHGPDEFFDVTLNRLPEKMEAAEKIFCISYYARSQLMRLVPYSHWSKLEVVPLGVDIQKYTPITKNASFVYNILSVGRLNVNKGFPLLIEAAKKLKELGKKVQFNIVGEGPERSSLQSLVDRWNLQDSIFFLGALSQQGTLSAYQTADLFVLPSFAEGVPVVLMEAMSMEIPCIASQLHGIPELIDHGKNGILIFPSDLDQLVDSMVRCIDNPDYGQELGKEGRKKIAAKYDLQQNTAQLALQFSKLNYLSNS